MRKVTQLSNAIISHANAGNKAKIDSLLELARSESPILYLRVILRTAKIMFPKPKN